MFSISAEAAENMKAWAKEVYPHEACGIILGGEFYPLVNTAPDTEHDFRLPVDTFLKANVEAVFHSHPDGPEHPTASDMQSQIATAVPWILCVSYADHATEPFAWGCGICPPLLGRQYRHGPSGTDNRGDCYAIVKDWYKLERGITIPEFPRDDGWWANGGDLYEQGFRQAGFEEVNPGNNPEIGDVAFMAIRSKVINHAAVYIGEGMFLQQLNQRMSRREPAGRWARMIKRWVRYVEKDSSARQS